MEEAVPQLLLALKILLLFGFKALLAFLFLPILDCWTASEMKKIWLNMPEDLVEEIAGQVKKGRFANRTEFIRDSVRRRVEEFKKEDPGQ